MLMPVEEKRREWRIQWIEKIEGKQWMDKIQKKQGKADFFMGRTAFTEV